MILTPPQVFGCSSVRRGAVDRVSKGSVGQTLLVPVRWDEGDWWGRFVLAGCARGRTEALRTDGAFLLHWAGLVEEEQDLEKERGHARTGS